MTSSVEELLLGGSARHTVRIPAEILKPAGDGGTPAAVVIRPLSMHDVQLIHKASLESQALTSLLMVQQALVEPKLSLDQVGQMHAGLVEFLVQEVNKVSGLSLRGADVEAAVQAPLARACFVLAREFGWTPEQCANLTVGQVLLYLEMMGRGEAPAA